MSDTAEKIDLNKLDLALGQCVTKHARGKLVGIYPDWLVSPAVVRFVVEVPAEVVQDRPEIQSTVYFGYVCPERLEETGEVKT